MKVLKIIGAIDIDAELPEDAKVTTVKMADYLVTEYEEQFDLIFCVHGLQTLWAHQVNEVIKKLLSELKDKGELHVQVPSTELACKALLKNQVDPVAYFVIWGTKDQPFHCGFTLLWLRAVMAQAGGDTRYANTRIIQLSLNEQDRKIAEHYVVATVIRD